MITSLNQISMELYNVRGIVLDECIEVLILQTAISINIYYVQTSVSNDYVSYLRVLIVTLVSRRSDLHSTELLPYSIEAVTVWKSISLRKNIVIHSDESLVYQLPIYIILLSLNLVVILYDQHTDVIEYLWEVLYYVVECSFTVCYYSIEFMI